jgi:hypothetical protein
VPEARNLNNPIQAQRSGAQCGVAEATRDRRAGCTLLTRELTIEPPKCKICTLNCTLERTGGGTGQAQDNYRASKIAKRRRFRRLLSSAAEWCIAFRGQKGKKDGRRPRYGQNSVSQLLTYICEDADASTPAAHFFPLPHRAVSTIPPRTQ